MDKPTTPGGLGGSGSSWPDQSGSDQDFGATGVFGTVKPSSPANGLPDSIPESDPLANLLREPPKPQPIPPPAPTPPPPPAMPPAPKPLAEPVVHKVVFGGGAAGSSPELLDRMRVASTERPPAPASAQQGSGGFTELLRTLGNDSPAPAPPAPFQQEAPKPEPPRPAADSGFTSLLRTLNSPEAPVTPVASPPPQPPSPGGFTELLRTAPASSDVAATTPPPLENKPGAFTQMFGTFGGAGAAPAFPPPQSREPINPPQSNAGSFTQMLSLEQRSAPLEPVYREEQKPSAGGLDYGLPPAAQPPAEVNRDPFSSPQAPPVQSTPPGSGVGITRLIQMLDEPSKQPTPRAESFPPPPPRGPEPGVWTQTFASLSTPAEPLAPPAKAPDWAPPQTPPASSGYPTPREPQYPAFTPQPPPNPSAAPPPSSGPSEYTRILDASRMRELAMRGGAGAESLSTPPAQSLPPAPSYAPPPMPSYPVPPSPPAMQGIGGMPQPGSFPPPQPVYPMQYPPQVPQMPSSGGMPQPPGMYAPAAPMPPVPQPVPAKPVQPGVSKLQQLVPIMLAVIILLLIVLLVTVFFLMKH